MSNRGPRRLAGQTLVEAAQRTQRSRAESGHEPLTERRLVTTFCWPTTPGWAAGRKVVISR